LKRHVLNYVEICKNKQIDYTSFEIELDKQNTFWVNFQRAGDFNLLHSHPNTRLSVVLYLKMPKEIKQELANYKDKVVKNGMLELAYGTTNDFSPGTYSFLPEESEIVIFPSHVMHIVYPFTSDGERWSINTNITRFSFN
jgi:Putative 2OG-Fe(II) oxygenase